MRSSGGAVTSGAGVMIGVGVGDLCGEIRRSSGGGVTSGAGVISGVGSGDLCGEMDILETW